MFNIYLLYQFVIEKTRVHLKKKDIIVFVLLKCFVLVIFLCIQTKCGAPPSAHPCTAALPHAPASVPRTHPDHPRPRSPGCTPAHQPTEEKQRPHPISAFDNWFWGGLQGPAVMQGYNTRLVSSSPGIFTGISHCKRVLPMMPGTIL